MLEKPNESDCHKPSIVKRPITPHESGWRCEGYDNRTQSPLLSPRNHCLFMFDVALHFFCAPNVRMPGYEVRRERWEVLSCFQFVFRWHVRRRKRVIQPDQLHMTLAPSLHPTLHLSVLSQWEVTHAAVTSSFACVGRCYADGWFPEQPASDKMN